MPIFHISFWCVEPLLDCGCRRYTLPHTVAHILFHFYLNVPNNLILCLVSKWSAGTTLCAVLYSSPWHLFRKRLFLPCFTSLQKLKLQSLFGLHVHSCSRWLRPCNLSPPLSRLPHLCSYARALLVSQDRRHLFVTPCQYILHAPFMLYENNPYCINMK